jgi:hypothetical protein
VEFSVFWRASTYTKSSVAKTLSLLALDPQPPLTGDGHSGTETRSVHFYGNNIPANPYSTPGHKNMEYLVSLQQCLVSQGYCSDKKAKIKENK